MAAKKAGDKKNQEGFVPKKQMKARMYILNPIAPEVFLEAMKNGKTRWT